MRRGWVVFLLLLSLIGASSSCAKQEESTVPEVPVKGMVTMVDLGADRCIPCKMMAPIIEQLKKDYAGKAAIVFIDVWKHPKEAPKFGIRVIPTQIFYDKSGAEVVRHEGFLDRESILKIFAKLGVN
ncbi:MAG: thioredoxin [Bacteroidetes bacterium]|nr:MAG: thioredoxin [Bacteroidota bacterium]